VATFPQLRSSWVSSQSNTGRIRVLLTMPMSGIYKIPPDRAGTKVPPNVPAVLWKPADLALIKYSLIDLAQLVFGLYLEMFQAEDWSKRFELLSLCNNGMLFRKRNAYNLYTRANFATIVQHIKNAEVTEWTDFIRHLMIDHILKDKILHTNTEHF
jgi:hypothetical protein